MLSQQQIRDNIPLFNNVTSDELKKLSSAVLDSIQYHTNIQTQFSSFEEIADPATIQAICDTIMSLVLKLLQSRSSNNDYSDQFQNFGLSSEHSDAMAEVINSRLDAICKEMASRSSGDKLTDLEWRFGLTAAASCSNNGSAFVQMKLSFENYKPVSVEMGIMEFYEFAADIKHIQQEMSNNFNI